MSFNNNGESLGEWAKQGYFLRECEDNDIGVFYKDDGSRPLAVFDISVATPEAYQIVCKRHNAIMGGGVAK